MGAVQDAETENGTTSHTPSGQVLNSTPNLMPHIVAERERRRRREELESIFAFGAAGGGYALRVTRRGYERCLDWQQTLRPYKRARVALGEPSCTFESGLYHTLTWKKMEALGGYGSSWWALITFLVLVWAEGVAGQRCFSGYFLLRFDDCILCLAVRYIRYLILSKLPPSISPFRLFHPTGRVLSG